MVQRWARCPLNGEGPRFEPEVAHRPHDPSASRSARRGRDLRGAKERPHERWQSVEVEGLMQNSGDAAGRVGVADPSGAGDDERGNATPSPRLVLREEFVSTVSITE